MRACLLVLAALLQIGAKAVTGDALQCEARGDYLSAAKIYDEAIPKDQDQWPDKILHSDEVDLWEDARGTRVCKQRIGPLCVCVCVDVNPRLFEEFLSMFVC